MWKRTVISKDFLLSVISNMASFLKLGPRWPVASDSCDVAPDEFWILIGQNDCFILYNFLIFSVSPQLHSNSDKGDGSVRYLLSGEGAGTIFTINESTGDIHATKSLDREKKNHYVLHARAIHSLTQRTVEPESEFIIKVQDVNDNAPTFPNSPFTASVPEMTDIGKCVCVCLKHGYITLWGPNILKEPLGWKYKGVCVCVCKTCIYG